MAGMRKVSLVNTVLPVFTLGNTVLPVFTLFTLLLLVKPIYSEPIDTVKDIFDMVGGIKTLAGIFGVTFVAVFGLIKPLQRAVKELIDVVVCVKSIINKHTHIPQLRELRKEVDEALEAAADVFDRIHQKRTAAKLRSLKS